MAATTCLHTWSGGLARTKHWTTSDRTRDYSLTYDDDARVTGVTHVQQDEGEEPWVGEGSFTYDEDGRVASVPGGDGGGTVYTTTCP